MDRVAMLQQEKWALEEKLVMLEQSGAAMADELVIKSELVNIHLMPHFCCSVVVLNHFGCYLFNVIFIR